VAANLLNDTRQTLWRACVRERSLSVATEPITDETLEYLAAVPSSGTATDELVELVADAVRLGHVERSGARLILLTRILDNSVEDLAREMNVKAPTLRKRRRRAEAALAAIGMVA
jgi:DNA-directed RNA polymerase specialized sigma24 family protein